jgi:transposase
MALTLTNDQRLELERRATSRIIRAEDAKRAKVILMLADGVPYSTIEASLWCYRDFINRWRRRFVAKGLDGLSSRHQGQRPTVLTPALEARILAQTRQTPPDGSTHWSTRKLATVLGIHHNHVQATWRRAGLKPHRFERYMLSDDPDFETKTADVIGLYLHPPQHAAVFAVDEKTAIQALDRLDPVLPLSPGRIERHGFEYYRYGTLSLFAALNTQTGEVVGQTVPRHTSAAFVTFLEALLADQPAHREIHVILDNLSTHKTTAVRAFLAAHPQVHLHFTPTYASWLNQVELWFGRIERDVLARGIFTSVADLARQIRRYIRRYNDVAKPIRWSYADPTRAQTVTLACHEGNRDESTRACIGRAGANARTERASGSVLDRRGNRAASEARP